MQVQRQQLRERQRQQPQIEGDARGGGDPREDAEVAAVALMHALPLRPEDRDGEALEDDGEQEADVINDVEDHCELHDSAQLVVGSRREDAQVEEDDGGADEEARRGVEDHLGVEHLLKPGQLFGQERRGWGDVP